MRWRVVNQQNSIPPVAHCSRTVAASSLITRVEGNGEVHVERRSRLVASSV
jgi:hypothetical protein